MSRLLIVEDNGDLAENLAEILASRGHDVVVAPSAEAALVELATGKFSGVLTDLRLPGRSGLELIAQLREQADPTPVVLMTAFADARATRSAQVAGALAVLFKPLDISRLFKLVSEFSREEHKVLLLDDNAALAQNIAEALEAGGFRPAVVTSLQEALDQEQLPVVAVVDYRLPDGSGLEAAERLWVRDPTLRIILLSGYTDEVHSRLEASPPPFLCKTLAKPIPVERLLDEVRAEAASAKATGS